MHSLDRAWFVTIMNQSTYIKYAVIVCNSIESPSGQHRATLIRKLF